MSDTTHPYAEQIRAALSRGVRVEHQQSDGAVIAVVAVVGGHPRIYVDVHLPGEAVPGVGEHVDDLDAGCIDLPSGTRVMHRALSIYRTTIDGLTVTTYAARR